MTSIGIIGAGHIGSQVARAAATAGSEWTWGTIKAAVAVEGDVLRITSTNPNNGEQVTDVQTIRTLEGDRLSIEDLHDAKRRGPLRR